MIDITKCIIDSESGKLVIEAAVKQSEYFNDVYIASVIVDNEDTFSPSGPSNKPLAKVTYSKEVPIISLPEIEENETEELPEIHENNTPSLAAVFPGGETAPPDTSEDQPSIDDSNIEDNDKPDDSENNSGEDQEEENKTEIVNATKEISLELTPSMLNLETLNDSVFFVYIKALGTPSPDTPCGQDNIITSAVAVNFMPIYNTAFGYIKDMEQRCQAPKEFIDFILKTKAFQLALKSGNYQMIAKLWLKLFKGKTLGVSDGNNNNCNCNGV